MAGYSNGGMMWARTAGEDVGEGVDAVEDDDACVRADVFRFSPGCGHQVNVSTGRALVAHQSADECDLLPVW